MLNPNSEGQYTHFANITTKMKNCSRSSGQSKIRLQSTHLITPKSVEYTPLNAPSTTTKKPQTSKAIKHKSSTMERWSCSIKYLQGWREHHNATDMETVREIAKATSPLIQSRWIQHRHRKASIPWMINFPMRYRLLTRACFGLSMFGGMAMGPLNLVSGSAQRQEGASVAPCPG